MVAIGLSFESSQFTPDFRQDLDDSSLRNSFRPILLEMSNHFRDTVHGGASCENRIAEQFQYAGSAALFHDALL